MEYFSVKNFEKYQTKKKFINTKLHILMLDVDIFEDPKVYQMSGFQFALFIRVLLAARKHDNRLPQDPRWLTARLGFPASNRRVDLQFLWDLDLLQPFSEPRIGLDRIGKERIGADFEKGASGGGRSEGVKKPHAPPDKEEVQKLIEETNKKLGVVR